MTSCGNITCSPSSRKHLFVKGLDMKQGCVDSTAQWQMCRWSLATRWRCPDPDRSSRCLTDNHLQIPLTDLESGSSESVREWCVKVLEVYFRFSQRESHFLQIVLMWQPSREPGCWSVSLPVKWFCSWMVSMLLQLSSTAWSRKTSKGCGMACFSKEKIW